MPPGPEESWNFEVASDGSYFISKNLTGSDLDNLNDHLDGLIAYITLLMTKIGGPNGSSTSRTSTRANSLRTSRLWMNKQQPRIFSNRTAMQIDGSSLFAVGRTARASSAAQSEHLWSVRSAMAIRSLVRSNPNGSTAHPYLL